ncbi:hypothetical protein [Sphingomonas sp. GC_Shp_3]|uniref:hypothetical protein n=1 Tax=Sphingomonas sp. GC_Shp_3 TaxID=2937383 RepID=UPI00226ABAAD|nr:hypothetical protein [Sphingomonas sp. GC_Shp_3]
MASYTVRVELHGASSSDYETLHTIMEAYNYHRKVKGVDRSGVAGTWVLPTGEYIIDTENAALEVRDTAKLLADAVKPGAWVLVTQAANRVWTTKKVQA